METYEKLSEEIEVEGGEGERGELLDPPAVGAAGDDDAAMVGASQGGAEETQREDARGPAAPVVVSALGAARGQLETAYRACEAKGEGGCGPLATAAAHLGLAERALREWSDGDRGSVANGADDLGVVGNQEEEQGDGVDERGTESASETSVPLCSCGARPRARRGRGWGRW